MMKVQLGQVVTVRTKRVYGPYLGKPSLPVGQYIGVITGKDHYDTRFDVQIIADSTRYHVLSEDIEVLEFGRILSNEEMNWFYCL